MNDFFIYVNEDSVYPTSHFSYNPDTQYPEYRYGDKEIASEKNDIYRMFRECLLGLELDSENAGTPRWNPFGDIIKKGETVVIKPNWVMHRNKNIAIKENSLECLITHPSLLRAVTDYCLIALNGTGRILVGDAPMQGCDLDQLLETSGHNSLFSFYGRMSEEIHPVDFRQYSTIVDKNKVLIGRKYNSGDSLQVDLGNRSRLNTTSDSTKKYKVSDYDEKVTNSFHKEGKHIYLINKEILSADVIINLCKPKCHRLAGMTAALKNVVGITYDKACLPHRTVGSSENGGDEYKHESFLKRLIGKILENKLVFEEKKYFKMSLLMRYSYGALYYMMRVFSKDKFLVGSWYGNDTIWRTVLDLNEILLYADKQGKISDERHRRVFNIADMIISGERNGPVAPEPKKIGAILAGSDAVVMDKIICKLMGFDILKIPTLYNAASDLKLSQKLNENFLSRSNVSEYNYKHIDDLQFPPKWRFKPYDTWKGYIELKG